MDLSLPKIRQRRGDGFPSVNAALGATVPGASKGTVDRRFALRYSHIEDNPQFQFVTRPSPVSASTVLADRLASQVMEEPPTIARLSGDEAVSTVAESIGEETPKDVARGLVGPNTPWSWETWGERSQRIWGRHSRILESLNWAATGALAGLAVAAAPAFFGGHGKLCGFGPIHQPVLLPRLRNIPVLAKAAAQIAACGTKGQDRGSW